MSKADLIKNIIKDSSRIKEEILRDENMLKIIDEISSEIIRAFKKDKKVLFCGNGGSAADAQHLAGELSGKFYLNREPLYAEPLNINTSFMTAVANDLSYEVVFSRLVGASGRPGDILVAISTSGNSINVIEAISMAKNKGMIVVGLTGETGGKMKGLCDYLIRVPSTDTPRIQESHILIGHIICEIVERTIFDNNFKDENESSNFSRREGDAPSSFDKK